MINWALLPGLHKHLVVILNQLWQLLVLGRRWAYRNVLFKEGVGCDTFGTLEFPSNPFKVAFLFRLFDFLPIVHVLNLGVETHWLIGDLTSWLKVRFEVHACIFGCCIAFPLFLKRNFAILDPRSWITPLSCRNKFVHFKHLLN